ncbi:MAG: hypothetical protein A3A86_07585 [Elusimicrobia bacterium RIFCSPLOWO2_01_FULL_60_11]|nr:MAG: hypothetical protein A3A86_07585 [Elusimicrobia bacterium RIFCSPLOWO2_01_FULL_60_11]
MRIWLQNKIVPERLAKVSVLDRGFLYGDGVYEAVRVYEGRIFRAEHHWKRLDGSLGSIHMRIPWSHSHLTAACLATARANGLSEALVRVTLSRGQGEVGYDPRSAKRPTLTVIASPIRKDLPRLWRSGVKIAVVNIRRNPMRSLSPAIKHTNALNGILAKIEALKTGAFEGVFLNLEGFVAEGTISNIFMVKRGVVKTPSLDCGILEGVTRRSVLELARKDRVRVVESRIPLKELLAADEVFLTSTTMEVMPVARIVPGRASPRTPGPVTRLLQKSLRELIAKELRLRGPI